MNINKCMCMFFYTSVKVYWCGFIYCMCVWMRVWYLKPWKIFSNHCSAGFSLFCEAVCYSARLTVLSIPSAASQPASQPVLGPLCFCQGWVLCALHVTPAPPTVGSGLARPRWDVLAFGQCPLQEARGRQEGYLGGEVPSKVGERQRTGPLAQSEPQFRGEKGWGDGFRVPQGAAFMCPEHQAPSGRSAERAVSVTRLPSQDRYALQLLVHSVHLSITILFCKMLRTPRNCCGV